jgi:hypothetical protein
MSGQDAQPPSHTRNEIGPSLLGLMRCAGATAPALDVYRADGYCNELLELRLPGREPLMVKRAHHHWGAARLRASRIAAGLLRRRTGVIAPAHLDVSADGRGRAVEAYWRIPLPTLRETWIDLPERRQPQALRSWGALLRRVHKVKLPGHGDLEGSSDARTLSAVLDEDLRGRLAPALRQSWPAAVELAEKLARRTSEVGSRCSGREVVLLHSDFHMGNVLCVQKPRSVRCVGVIDLETAWGGPPEVDIARVQVLHGPELGAPLPDGWLEHFIRGYDAPLDRDVLAFFRTEHLLNLGYHAALAGWWEHVDRLRAMIVRELA